MMPIPPDINLLKLMNAEKLNDIDKYVRDELQGNRSSIINQRRKKKKMRVSIFKIIKETFKPNQK